MKPYEVHVLSGAMPGCFQELLHTAEARLARQIPGDVLEPDRLDRIDDDGSFIHRVAAAHLHVRTRPDADAAADAAAPNTFAQFLLEYHVYRWSLVVSRSFGVRR